MLHPQNAISICTGKLRGYGKQISTIKSKNFLKKNTD